MPNNRQKPTSPGLVGDVAAAPPTPDGAPKQDFFDQGKIVTKVDSIIDTIVQPCGWLVLVVAMISVYEVFMRYVVDLPTKWVHETSTFLIAVVFLVGGARALARNQHVQINLLQYLLPKRHRRKLRIVNGIILILVCMALTYVSSLTAWQSTHARQGAEIFFERTGTFWDPPFPAWIKITLFVTCCLMTIQSIAQMCKLFAGSDADPNGEVDIKKEERS